MNISHCGDHFYKEVILSTTICRLISFTFYCHQLHPRTIISSLGALVIYYTYTKFHFLTRYHI